MDNYMKLEIAALGENESFARSAVAAFALTLSPTLSELSDIKTAVSEAVTNCIVHAYGGANAWQKIVIECNLVYEESQNTLFKERGGRIHIRITDYGCGIDDVEKALQPFFTTRVGEERSGMGFTIMQTFMEDLSVQSKRGGGTIISMSKTIGAAENMMIKERANA